MIPLELDDVETTDIDHLDFTPEIPCEKCVDEEGREVPAVAICDCPGHNSCALIKPPYLLCRTCSTKAGDCQVCGLWGQYRILELL